MKNYLLLAALLAAALTLSACAPAQPAAAPTAALTAEPTAEASAQPAPEATAEPQAQAPEVKAEYRKITAEQAKARIDSGDPVIILDVRTPDEYAQGHIQGAVLLPLDTINEGTKEVLSDLNAEILVYCRSGNRSGQAARLLVGMGYTGIYDFGGIIDWPYGTVTD